MKTNTKSKTPRVTTHEGARARVETPIDQLRRSVSACFLWEDTFYEDGESIANRIRTLAAKVDPDAAMALAIKARRSDNMRHAPLMVTLGVLANPTKVQGLDSAIAAVINRADELTEIVAMYWKDGKRPLPAALKRGLALAFGKFDEYQLAKYDRKADVRLRDVLRLVHPTPDNAEQSDMWKRLIAGELKTPDTWEVALSGGANKKETFERLIREGNLGYLALLRNLRNMEEAGCDRELVMGAIRARNGGAHKVLPFRFVAAARHAPQFEPALDEAMQASIATLPMLKGRTAVLVDVSGSMDAKLSSKSDMTRIDAAAALAALVNGDDVRVFTFDTACREAPKRKGMAQIDAIKKRVGGGTLVGNAVNTVNRLGHFDRMIVITDEQSADSVPAPNAKVGYMVNVAAYQHGVSFKGPWVSISGFSENIFRFIAEHEALAREPETVIA